MAKSPKSLDKLRSEVDDVDNAIHDSIMRRAEIVAKIGALKRADDSAILRPGREAKLLRRLLARHRGTFPKPALVRIWREIIAAPLHLQGPFSVAVYCPPETSGLWDLARDHYGSHTQMVAHDRRQAVIGAVADGTNTVGILPVPLEDDPMPWWPRLMVEGERQPRVVLRLPIAGAGNNRDGNVAALGVACVAAEDTGDDRSLLAFDTETETSRGRLGDACAEVGLAARFFASTKIADRGWRHLVEIDGFVIDGDQRIAELAATLDLEVGGVFALGTYAVPFTVAELEADG